MTKQRSRWRLAGAAVAVVGAVTAVTAVTVSPAYAATACEVGYQLRSEWAGGFLSHIIVENRGDTTLSNWALTYTYPGDQRLAYSERGHFEQAPGSHEVTLTAPVTLRPGDDTLLIVHGQFETDNTFPTGFALNGEACDLTPPRLVVFRTSLTIREGGWNRLSVALSGPPTTDTVVAAQIAPGGDPDLTFPYQATYQQLTFTPADWKVLQYVTVTARHDHDHVSGSATLTIAPQSPEIPGLSMTVTEYDDDGPNGPIIVMDPDPRGPLLVPEGGQARFTLRLPAPPASPVRLVVFHGTDRDLQVVAGGDVTFTADNWNVPHEMTIAAAEDADAIDGWSVILICGPGGALPVLTTIWTEVDND